MKSALRGRISPARVASLQAWGLLVLRAGAGGMLALGHGWSKLSTFAQHAATFPDPLGVGHRTSLGLTIFAEFACAGAVALGLLTRLACLPVLFMLMTAGFVIHAHDLWARKEMAFLYAVPFLAVLLLGPGRFSLDEVVAGLLRSRRRFDAAVTDARPPASNST